MHWNKFEYDPTNNLNYFSTQNKDFDEFHFKIQSAIVGLLRCFKSVNRVTNPDESVNYPLESFNHQKIPLFHLLTIF